MKRAVWIPLCMHFLLIYMGVKGDSLIIALAVDGVDSVFFQFCSGRKKNDAKKGTKWKKERKKEEKKARIVVCLNLTD